MEVLFGLAGKANDDVGREGDVRNGRAEPIDQCEVLLPRVAAVHCLEDARGPRLHGKVEVRHNGRDLGHRGYRLV